MAIRRLFWIALVYGGSVFAEVAETHPVVADEPRGRAEPLLALSTKSDEQLTEIAGRWNELSAGERDALITEVKSRMARRGSRDGVLRIRLTRRYGTVVRRRGSATLRIERVQRTVKPPAAAPPAPETTTPAFGVGFEQRVKERIPTKTQSTPVDEEH
ncbi:MAG: hypothetical protein QF515_07730 [Pseudomonadales bacterium]|nr:hypothetical protein [Pseudomonadales bacterium]MDP6826987.1 hypothetical protein [Pseudomonadales bacterium]